MFLASGLAFILASICIFVQVYLHKKGICLSRFNLIEGSFSYLMAIIYLVIGITLLCLGKGVIRVKIETTIASIAPIAPKIHILLLILVGVIIFVTLLAIYVFIAKLLFTIKNIDSRLDEITLDMPFAQKIQCYMKTKRDKSIVFHTLYQGTLGFLFIIIMASLSLLLAKKTGISGVLTVLVMLFAALIALKQLFFIEINKADNWLPILYELDKESNEESTKSLIEEELDEIITLEKTIAHNELGNFTKGSLIALYLLIALILVTFIATFIF